MIHSLYSSVINHSSNIFEHFAIRIELLGSTVVGLLSLPIRELQALAVDISGAAVISFALRVLFSPYVIEVELDRSLLSTNFDHGKEFLFRFSGSHFCALGGARAGGASFSIDTRVERRRVSKIFLKFASSL